VHYRKLRECEGIEEGAGAVIASGLWIKTVRDGEGQTFPACDPCYDANSSRLVIVPGVATVAGRCHGGALPT
jgi:hypothetical protein